MSALPSHWQSPPGGGNWCLQEPGSLPWSTSWHVITATRQQALNLAVWVL